MSPEKDEIPENHIYIVVTLAYDIDNPECFSLQAIFEIAKVKTEDFQNIVAISNRSSRTELPEKLVGIMQQHFFLPQGGEMQIPGVIPAIVVQKNISVQTSTQNFCSKCQ